MNHIHIVAKGDSLSRIAKRYGVPLRELQNINDLPNPNKLEIGQKIRIKKDKVLGFQALVLDNDRNPIDGLPYRLEFSGKIIKGITSQDGLTHWITVPSPQEHVRILVERLDKSLKEIATISSGFGNKLVTLVSPSVKIRAKTEPYHTQSHGEIVKRSERAKPIYDLKLDRTPTRQKNDLGIKVTPVKTPDGKPLIKVEGDIPDLGFLDDYNGDEVTEEDYVRAAKELGIEKAAIKAFALVESAGSGYFMLGTRRVPKILYERHKFSGKTGHKFSLKYPDISLPTAYFNSSAKYVVASADYKRKRGIASEINYYRPINKRDDPTDKREALTLKELIASGKASVEKDKYLSDLGSYKRLIKAYQCDPAAALESCSWGAFQIMGEYWKVMGYASVEQFTKSMARSPKEQLTSFVRYINYVNPKLKKFLRDKNWVATAEAYNGPSYRDNKYDVKLEAAYLKLKND